MPKAFDKCVAAGGKVRTKSLAKSQYVHVCFKNGKSVAGYVKTKKGRGK
jgi:hypothetical protein